MKKLCTEHLVLVSLNKCQENRRQESLAPPLNFQSQELSYNLQRPVLFKTVERKGRLV